MRADVRNAWEQVRRRPELPSAFAQAGAVYLGGSDKGVQEMIESEFLRHAGLIARFPPKR